MKKLFFLFIIFLFIGLVACSDDDNDLIPDSQPNEDGDKGEEPNYDLIYVSSEEEYFDPSAVTAMYTYNKKESSAVDYIDSPTPSTPVENGMFSPENLYYVCRNETPQATVPLYVKYHAETDDYFLSTSKTSDKDDYKKGGTIVESPGYIVPESKYRVVPLDEYYSKKNDDLRYFVSEYDKKEMKEAGEDYEYVRTLGYVFPGQNYNVPKTLVSYTNKSGDTKTKLDVMQILAGNYLAIVRGVFMQDKTSHQGNYAICNKLLLVWYGDYSKLVYVPDKCGLRIDIDENGKVSLESIKPGE